MPRPKITLTEENQDDLIVELRDKSNKGKEYKGNWPELHNRYWKYYLAEPQSKTKTWPWQNACNFMSPMVTVAVDTLNSLEYDAMLSGRPELIGNDEGMSDEDKQLLDEFFFEFVWKKVLSLELVGDSWNFNTLIDGTSIAGYRWMRDKTVLRTDEIKSSPRTKTETRIVDGQEIEGQFFTGEFNTTTTEVVEAVQADRPVVDILDMEKVFIAPGTKRGLGMEGSLQYPNCPWYFIDSWKTVEQARQMRAQGWEGLEESGKAEDELEGLKQERELTERERTQAEQDELSQSDPRKILFRVFFMRKVLPATVKMPDGGTETQKYDDADGVPEEIIVWYLPKSKRISLVMPLSRMYPDNQRPHVDNHHSTVGNFFFSLGVPALLEDVMKLDTSATRQLVDHGTLVNKPWAFYEPAKTGLLPSLQSIAPGAMIATEDASGVKVAQFTSRHDFWQLIRVISQEWQERLTNVTDFVGGRNAALPNSPRTLGGQNLMLNQANVAFAHRIALRVIAFKILFRRIKDLYQANAPENLEFDFYNRATGLINSRTLPRQLLQSKFDFSFRLNPNRAQETQSAQNRLALVRNMIFLQQDPEALRAAMSDVYRADGKLDDFNNRIWPKDKLEIQKQQLAAQQGLPPAPPEPQSEELPPAPVPERDDIEDMAVNL